MKNLLRDLWGGVLLVLLALYIALLVLASFPLLLAVGVAFLGVAFLVALGILGWCLFETLTQ